MASLHKVAVGKTRRKTLRDTCPTRSLQGCPQRSGIVLKLKIRSPKKPNSAKRKVLRVKLSNRLDVTCKIGGQGSNLRAFASVLIRGGRYNDVPGVRYSAIRGQLDFGWAERFARRYRRSKFGVSIDNLYYSMKVEADNKREESEEE